MKRIRMRKMEFVALSIVAVFFLAIHASSNVLAFDGQDCAPEIEDTIIHFENCLFDSIVDELDNGIEYSFDSFSYSCNQTTGFVCHLPASDLIDTEICGKAVVGGDAIQFLGEYIEDNNGNWIPAGSYTLFRTLDNFRIYFMPQGATWVDECSVFYVADVVQYPDAGCPDNNLCYASPPCSPSDTLTVGNSKFCVIDGKIILQ